ncbi:hypothetical protein DH2020_036073 [Rehmannia glutinosa]|uniref:Bifunctional inhibitor/plant lipid transfer protein/seed storage helical domain-containing protein n=1 Tax=Rehmannia glutinosa TaxID=99300 RepID=A0ABR0V4P1_REHGL
MASRIILIFALAISATVLFSPVSGQIITTPCTPTMITAFTPCMNFVTNSSPNGTTPTAACCNSLSSLMTNGKECLCLIATGSVPFRIPINRTLAVSLPRACNMPGVPLQCKAAGAPAPAPAPELAPPEPLSPRSAPGADASPTPPAPTSTAPFIPQSSPPSLAPDGDIVPTEGDIVPTLTPPGMRPTLTTSSTHPSHSALPSLMAVLGLFIILKFY